MVRMLIISLIGVLLYLQFVLWVGKGGIRDVGMMRDQIARQRVEISALKERNLGLAAEVLDLKEGVEAIEERARSEMGIQVQQPALTQHIARVAGRNLVNERQTTKIKASTI